MLSDTPGLHHVTGIVGDPEANAAFYGEALGLRLLRRTVNYGDLLRYHLYFGDATGSPGSVFTVFPDPNADPGRAGKPGYEAVAFAVPPDSLGYWRDRLGDRGVDAGPLDPDARFGDRGLALADPSGTRVELVAAPEADGTGAEGDGSDDGFDPWTEGPVPAANAVRGLHGVTALPTDPYGTASVLETLGFEYVAESSDRVRYRAPGDRATPASPRNASSSSGSRTAARSSPSSCAVAPADTAPRSSSRPPCRARTSTRPRSGGARAPRATAAGRSPGRR